MIVLGERKVDNGDQLLVRKMPKKGSGTTHPNNTYAALVDAVGELSQFRDNVNVAAKGLSVDQEMSRVCNTVTEGRVLPVATALARGTRV